MRELITLKWDWSTPKSEMEKGLSTLNTRLRQRLLDLTQLFDCLEVFRKETVALDPEEDPKAQFARLMDMKRRFTRQLAQHAIIFHTEEDDPPPSLEEAV